MSRVGVLLLILLLPIIGYCQDLNLSQYFSSPLILNSALCGNFEGRDRINLNSKNQWNAVTKSYYVAAASYDTWFYTNNKTKRDKFGVGGVFSYDNAGDGMISNVTGKLALAYHKPMNLENTFICSLGFHAGYFQKTIDIQKLTFQHQWTGTDFDHSIQVNDNLSSQSIHNLDIGAGVMITYKKTENITYHLGSSLGYLNQPIESFYGDITSYKSPRLVLHADASCMLSSAYKLEPGIYFVSQRNAQEFILGSNLNLNYLYLGLWYRSTGELAPLVGLANKNLRLMVNYDVNVSRFRMASNLKGGLEISIQYIIPNVKVLAPSMD